LSQKCADTAEDADNEDETEQERDISDKCKSIKLDSEKLDNNIELPWDVTRIDVCEILAIQKLNDWDYPIFDLARLHPDTILSKVGVYICILYILNIGGEGGRGHRGHDRMEGWIYNYLCNCRLAPLML
jgi:hypothetical protein